MVEIIASIALGICLAAAAGLRVFVPLLGAGVAARFDLVPLSPGLEWLAAPLALGVLGTAAVIEVIAYKIPILDHALDVIASPLAIVAGVLSSAAVFVDLPTGVRWGLALVAGGGVAATFQASTVTLRLKSTATTGGVANPALALGETIGASALVVCAVVIPLISVSLVIGAAVLVARWLWRARRHSA